eukprot:818550-Pelagomonas_calceolata.AAC.1
MHATTRSCSLLRVGTGTCPGLKPRVHAPEHAVGNRVVEVDGQHVGLRPHLLWAQRQRCHIKRALLHVHQRWVVCSARRKGSKAGEKHAVGSEAAVSHQKGIAACAPALG